MDEFDYFKEGSGHWYYVKKGTSALYAVGPFMTKTQAIKDSLGEKEIIED